MFLYELSNYQLDVYRLTRRTERSVFGTQWSVGDGRRFPIRNIHLTIFEDRDEAIEEYVRWIDLYLFAIPEDAKDVIRRLVTADLMAKEARLNAEMQPTQRLHDNEE